MTTTTDAPLHHINHEFNHGGFDFFMNDTATDRRQHHREIHHHSSNFDFLHITDLYKTRYQLLEEKKVAGECSLVADLEIDDA
ncbi:hypothetical protein L2E82_22775 [Cichorium intybus]|uniref:Uncharacterized protein n=1 Tax=Cichorium intybus TaxID=13427 RepID=A0ACB9DYH4_CICIN|nr:hypothetical protein L2E82_22775 [Cichorium intybus]